MRKSGTYSHKRMSDAPQPSRPKIQVVRLPSCEQAKLRPLLEGGVQLQAQYQHVLYGDYVSCSSLDETKKQYFSFHDHEYMEHKTALITKSLDNIFVRQLTSGTEQGSPILWQDATHSEEELYHASHSLPGATRPGNKASRFSGARSRISALLKKLSPRSRHKAAAPNSPCPWVVVEFSKQDLESPDVSGRASSVPSDHSFDMAVQASRLRREQAAYNKNTHGQVLYDGSDKPCEQGEAKKHQTSSRGFATTKHRAAFNTGSSRQVSSGTAAAKVKAKVAATSRPHTLRIQLSSHHQHNFSMASDESIGSCSLDADVTDSDASECVDLSTVSAHTLRSLQLSAKTPDPDSIATKSGGTSTPEYVKRTARLFESTDSTALGSQSPKSSVLRSNGRHVGSSKTSDIRSVVVVNGTNSVKTGENLLNADGFTGKKPSYLGLSCSISGYSGITTYDSKLREGFLSRDHSPGRFGIQKSRDVSPLRQGANQFENHLISAYKSDCGNFLVAPPMKAGVVGSGDKVDSATSLKSRPNIVEGDTPGSKNIRTTSVGNQIEVVKDVNGFDQLGRENSKVQSSQSQRMMGDGGKFSETVQHTVNGVADKLGITSDDWDHRPVQSSHLGNCSSSSTEQFFSDSKSNIRESTRNFMSSMLNTESSFSSAYCETSVTETTKSREVTDFSSTVKNSSLTSVPRDGFRAFSPVRWSPESPKTALRDFPDSCVTSSPRDSSSLSSSLKRSPDSPKTSKDSLSAPAATSSQKRSPGAVRVVEFTSQTKSYVRTAFVSSNSVELTSAATTQGYSDSSQLRSCVDGSQTTSYVKSICSGLTTCGSIDSQGPSNTLAAQSKRPELETTAWTSKSFIQQRVERLYGPGALAQGFFRRTRHKPADEVQGPSESCTPHNGHRNNSSPALPVLRHLRPEFRAQLSLGSAAKKLHEHSAGTSVEDTRASVSKRSATKVIPLQQQISVESLAESLTDLQPAAPDVVLPIEQSQSVSSQPCEQSEESVDPVTETHKDGHYFLKALKNANKKGSSNCSRSEKIVTLRLKAATEQLLKQETERLNELVEVAEADLAKGELLPEDALGKLRAASGQARLLIRQKLQQFEGLCHKNIAQNSEEPFPTTSEDLAGFWDMVMLQVEHVNRLFEEITTLRAANWVEAQVLGKDVADSAPKRRVGGGTRRSSAAPTKSSASSEATRKAREEGRRKMMEERRKAMREKRDTAATSGQVEIFVPQENGN